MDVVVTDDQMTIGRCDIDAAWTEALAFRRRHDRNGAAAGEYPGQETGIVVGRVKHDEECGREVGGQGCSKLFEGLNAAH